MAVREGDYYRAGNLFGEFHYEVGTVLVGAIGTAKGLMSGLKSAAPKFAATVEAAEAARLAKVGDGAVGVASKYAVGDFAVVSGKISQKQLRHIVGRKEYRGGGFLNSLEDAQNVLDSFRSGKTTILGKSKQGFPIVRYEGITGTNVNILSGFTNQPTNVFMIKGIKSPSVVPMNPNWIP